MVAECPFCEYEGSGNQVEAHISGKSDEAHQGRAGGQYRGLIESSHGDTEEPGGIPIPISSTVLVAATVLVLVVAVYRVRSVDPASTAETEEDEFYA